MIKKIVPKKKVNTSDDWPYEVRLLLDSGAYSAWVQKSPIDIKEYISFIKRNEKWLWNYVSLDVIPGSFDAKRELSHVEEAAKQSYKNHQIMKDAGLRPIPVHHGGEDIKDLEKLLKDGEEYIGVSPFKDWTYGRQARWLDDIFNVITDKNGYPFVKVHGFGVTQNELIRRYPWYTIDSTTWRMTPAYGQILIPLERKGRPDFTVKPQTINVTGETNSNDGANSRSFDGLGNLYKEYISRYLAEYAHCTIGQLRYDNEYRSRAMLAYFHEIEKACVGIRFKDAGRNSFTKKPLVGYESINDLHLHIMFACATLTQRRSNEHMIYMGARNRLLSYFIIRNNEDQLAEYVERGTVGAPYNREQPTQKKWNTNYVNYRALQLIDMWKKYNAEESTTGDAADGSTSACE